LSVEEATKLDVLPVEGDIVKAFVMDTNNKGFIYK
jgi:hypothetical protein